MGVGRLLRDRQAEADPLVLAGHERVEQAVRDRGWGAWAGVRHFDVAPMYGYGEAESCLGDFLQKHRGQITITTKYGIAPPKKSAIIKLGRNIAGPVLKQLPSLKHRLAQAATARHGVVHLRHLSGREPVVVVFRTGFS